MAEILLTGTLSLNSINQSVNDIDYRLPDKSAYCGYKMATLKKTKNWFSGPISA